jgi:iron complex outermembrane receptor protein
VNAKYVTPWSLPTFFKIGVKTAEEYRKTDNTVPYLTWSYIGPGGGANGSWAAYPSQRVFNTQMGLIKALNVANLPQLASRSAISVLFREHPEYFVNNATVENYYTAYIANHRDFKQDVPAFYGMGNTRWGKLQLQAGVRWERTDTASKEFDPLTATEVQRAGYAISTTTRRATTLAGMNYQFFTNPLLTRRGTYDDFFPSASLKYSIRPDLQAQLGYAHAISRPPVDALAGVWNVNEVARVVTAPNPELRPEKSNTYVGRIAWYFEPVGSLTLLGQQTEISNQRINTRLTAVDFGYANDPEYADYEFQSFTNRSEVYRYRSLELGYNQQLSFLPLFLRGTSVGLSYTRNYANQYFPGITPHKFTGSLTWTYGRVSLRAGGVWQDDTPFTTVFGRYQRHNLKVDLSGSFRLAKNTSLFFSGRNVFNDPNLLYEGDPLRGLPAYLYRYGNYGVSWLFGVKGNF